MLIELRVRDLAVIADVTIPLKPGLNVLTGETGAGKSMLVDALALLLGEVCITLCANRKPGAYCVASDPGFAWFRAARNGSRSPSCARIASARSSNKTSVA